jgi:nucleotide-binding universal stress UspA family protein
MRLLLAVDGSPPSRAAVHQVRDMTLPAGATVRVLSVAQGPAPSGEFGGADYGRLAEDLRHVAESIVRDAANDLRRLERVELVVRSGDPRVEILVEARSWAADLIVMGSHGRTGLRRLFTGSVAEYVMRHATCSVEIAREPHPPAPLHA